MKSKRSASKRALAKGRTKVLGYVMGVPRGSGTEADTVEIQIDSKQRARMAVRYPHLYAAPVEDMLVAIAEERARSIGVAD
jgi:hypothetical protein